MRTLKHVYCKICGYATKTNGMATHIKSSHNLTTSEYVEKYGEFRPKYLTYQNNASDKYKCIVCNTECVSDRHLSFHVKEHNLTKAEYVKKYIFNDVIPDCECGCGNSTLIKDQYPYINRFINGHNSITQIGCTRTEEAKAKQKAKAKGRYSLDWFKERNGDIEGERLYEERRKWLKSRNLPKGEKGRFIISQ